MRSDRLSAFTAEHIPSVEIDEDRFLPGLLTYQMNRRAEELRMQRHVIMQVHLNAGDLSVMCNPVLLEHGTPVETSKRFNPLAPPGIHRAHLQNEQRVVLVDPALPE